MRRLFILVVSVVMTTGSAYADLTDGLMAYYPFTGNANDVSANGNDGVVSGATLVPDRNGNPLRAYYFDGGDGISIPHDVSLNFTDAITISAWIKPDSFGSGDRMVIGKSNYTTTTNFLVRTQPNGVLRWEYETYNNTNNGILQTGVWQHIVVTAAEPFGVKQIYVDGTLRTISVTGSTGSHGTVSNPMTIGYASYGSERFVGSIDEVRVYDRVLADAEIQQLFASTDTQPSDCGDTTLDLTALGVQSAIDLDLVNGELWAADAGLNRYVRINPSIPSVLGTVTYPFPINDHGSEYEPSSGRLLHVIDDDEGYGTFDAYAETDLSGGVLFGPANLSPPSEDPAGLAVDPGSGRVWITTWDPQNVRQIREINRTNGATVSVVGGSHNPIGLAYYPATGRLIYGTADSRIFEIGLNGAGERKLVDLPTEVGEITGMTVTEAGDVWIVARLPNEARLLSQSCFAPSVPAMSSWGSGGLAAALALLPLLMRRFLLRALRVRGRRLN